MKNWLCILLLISSFAPAQTPPSAITVTFSARALRQSVKYVDGQPIRIKVNGIASSVTSLSFTDTQASSNGATPFIALGSPKGFAFMPDKSKTEGFRATIRRKASKPTATSLTATFTAPVLFRDNTSRKIQLTFKFNPTSPPQTLAVDSDADAPQSDPTSLTPTGFIVPDALTLSRLLENQSVDAPAFSEKVKDFYGIKEDAPFFNAFPAPPVDSSIRTFMGLGADEKSGILGNAVSAVGGLDVTTIADGFAQFLVKRTKQELNAAFFNRLRDSLDSPRLRDFALLFPQTKQALQLIGDEIYDYDAYMNTLRTTFQHDLSTLPPHLLDWINDGTLAPYFNKEQNRYLKASLQSALYFYNEVSTGTHPGLAIEQYPVDDFMSDLPALEINHKPVKVGELMNGFIEVSKSLRSGAKTKRYWITADSVRLLTRSKEDRAVKFYFAMLYTQLNKEGVGFGRDTALANLIMKWKADKRITDISQFLNQAAQVEDALRQATSHQNRDSLAYEDYFRLLDQFTRTARTGYKLVFKLLNKPERPDKAEIVFGVMGDVANVGLDVNRRKYSAAIAHTVSIYTRLTPDTTPMALTYTATNSTNTTTGAESPENYRQRVVRQLFRYGSFIAAVGEAKTPEEVAAAIEVFALPAGSSSIKRESQFNVSLNAFTGLLGGHEYINGISDNSWFNTTAISAPIGIAVSWGRHTLHPKKLKPGQFGHTSWSIFVPLIDLGAVTAFRFTNDGTDPLPKITLGSLFAPGLAFSVGIGKTPVSITGGWQVGPLLRGVTAAQNNVVDTKYTRWFISANIDLPLLNFSNRR